MRVRFGILWGNYFIRDFVCGGFGRGRVLVLLVVWDEGYMDVLI